MARQKKVYDNPEEVQPIAAPVAKDMERAEAGAVAKQIRSEAVLEKWVPKTELGKKVKTGEITDIRQILDKGLKIREAEIVDKLVSNLTSDFVLIGQAHGKFGGGKRRLIRQTQKKTAEGNKPVFTAMAIIGNGDGYFGVGVGTAKESMPAREKALRDAKLNIQQIARGCGEWKCGCGEPHSLPFKVEGRAGSVRVKLMPAPKGTGLACEDEIKKLLKMAGYKDVWTKTFGQTRKKINFINATLQALRTATEMKVKGVKPKVGSLSA
ncbi:MAG: 30S ribosomal protein S5 [Candidatus Nanoarchaeia archaeon]